MDIQIHGDAESLSRERIGIMDKREGIYAVDARTIQTPKTGDTVYVDYWWCADEFGNVYITTWGAPLAYEKESSCRLVGSRFGLPDAVFLPLAYHKDKTCC